MNKMLLAAVAATAMISSAAFAAYTVNANGTGFVGKGDVQIALGLNNSGLQALGNPSFTINSVVVSETSWICTNDRNENTQERERTTTESTQGILSSIARVKNQITGFNLTGFSGDVSETSATEGNPLNSCPNANGNWSLTTPAGDPEVISSSGGLYVNGVLIGEL